MDAIWNRYVGRRSRLNIKKGKTIRRRSDGAELFDDYWTESDSDECNSSDGGALTKKNAPWESTRIDDNEDSLKNTKTKPSNEQSPIESEKENNAPKEHQVCMQEVNTSRRKDSDTSPIKNLTTLSLKGDENRTSLGKESVTTTPKNNAITQTSTSSKSGSKQRLASGNLVTKPAASPALDNHVCYPKRALNFDDLPKDKISINKENVTSNISSGKLNGTHRIDKASGDAGNKSFDFVAQNDKTFSIKADAARKSFALSMAQSIFSDSEDEDEENFSFVLTNKNQKTGESDLSNRRHMTNVTNKVNVKQNNAHNKGKTNRSQKIKERKMSSVPHISSSGNRGENRNPGYNEASERKGGVQNNSGKNSYEIGTNGTTSLGLRRERREEKASSKIPVLIKLSGKKTTKSGRVMPQKESDKQVTPIEAANISHTRLSTSKIGKNIAPQENSVENNIERTCGSSKKGNSESETVVCTKDIPDVEQRDDMAVVEIDSVPLDTLHRNHDKSEGTNNIVSPLMEEHENVPNSSEEVERILKDDTYVLKTNESVTTELGVGLLLVREEERERGASSEDNVLVTAVQNKNERKSTSRKAASKTRTNSEVVTNNMLFCHSDEEEESFSSSKQIKKLEEMNAVSNKTVDTDIEDTIPSVTVDDFNEKQETLPSPKQKERKNTVSTKAANKSLHDHLNYHSDDSAEVENNKKADSVNKAKKRPRKRKKMQSNKLKNVSYNAEKGADHDLTIKEKKDKASRKRKRSEENRNHTVSETLPSNIISPPPPRDLTPGVRRSKRVRIQPLEHWRNQRIHYQRCGDGYTIGGIEKGFEDEPFFLVKSLKNNKSTKRPTKKQKTAASSDKFDDLSVHDVSALTSSNVVEEPNGQIPVICWETGEEISANVVSTRDSLEWMGLEKSPVTEADTIAIATTFHLPNAVTGYLRIRGLQEKKLQHLPNNSATFIILYGKLLVQINRTMFVLKSGESFHIPQGNSYNVKNLRNDEAELHFTIFSMCENEEKVIDKERSF